MQNGTTSASVTTANILITGATDGLGLALARLWAQQGWRNRPVRLILVGRKPLAELDATFFTPHTYCQADLAKADDLALIADWLDAQAVEQLDLLVHNAGVGYVGNVGAQTTENIGQLVAVNLEAPMLLTHQLLPRVAAAHGKISFISSLASTLPGPEYAVYSATKAALNGFVRNLRIELHADLKTRPIDVQLILPGATNTGMHAKSGATLARMNWTRFPAVEKVSMQIASAIAGRQKVVTIGTLNRLVRFAGQNFSTLLDGIMRQTARRGKEGQSTRSGAVSERGAMADRGSSSGSTSASAQPHCVITGAADGIGKALAHRYAAAGYRITGLDFDAQRAEQTRQELAATGAQVDFIQVNLADGGELTQAWEKLLTRPPVDILIHNAGINAVGRFAQMDWARQQMVLAVNFVAPLLLTRALLAANHLNAGGTLVCISSLSRFVGYPGAAAYAASKDGLASYARSLAVALAPQNINVLTVYPGPTRTAHARRYSPDNRRENSRMVPDELARRIVNATAKRQRVLIPGVGNQLFAWAGQLLPTLTESVMKRTILEKVDDM